MTSRHGDSYGGGDTSYEHAGLREWRDGQDWIREVAADLVRTRVAAAPDTSDCPRVCEAFLRARAPEWTRFASLVNSNTPQGLLCWASDEAGSWLRESESLGKIESRRIRQGSGRRTEYRWLDREVSV